MKKTALVLLLITVSFYANAEPTSQEGAVTQLTPASNGSSTPNIPAKEAAVSPTTPAQEKSSQATSSTPPPSSEANQSATPPAAKKNNSKKDNKPKTEDVKEVKKGCVIKPVMADEDYYACGTKPPSYVVHFKNAR